MAIKDQILEVYDSGETHYSTIARMIGCDRKYAKRVLSQYRGVDDYYERFRERNRASEKRYHQSDKYRLRIYHRRHPNALFKHACEALGIKYCPLKKPQYWKTLNELLYEQGYYELYRPDITERPCNAPEYRRLLPDSCEGFDFAGDAWDRYYELYLMHKNNDVSWTPKERKSDYERRRYQEFKERVKAGDRDAIAALVRKREQSRQDYYKNRVQRKPYSFNRFLHPEEW